MRPTGEIKGVAWLHEKMVEVRIRVIDREGRQITAASADIPSGLFPGDLLNPEPTIPGAGPSVMESVGKGISRVGSRWN